MRGKSIPTDSMKKIKVADTVWVKILSPQIELYQSSELLTYICYKSLKKSSKLRVGLIKAAHLGDVSTIFKVVKITPEDANVIDSTTKIKIVKASKVLKEAFTEIESSKELFWPQSAKKIFINSLKASLKAYKDKIWELFDNTILLSGPPGNGKSQGAVTIGRELGFKVYEVDIPTIVGNKYAGETAERISSLKKEILEVERPTMVIFNDFEILAAGYYYAAVYGGFFEIRSAILNLLDKLKNSRNPVIVVGTSNVPPNYLDKAIIDRFSLRIMINPTINEKRKFVEYLIEKYSKYVESDVDIGDVMRILEGMSMRSIKSILKQSVNECILENKKLTEDVIKKVAKELDQYQDIWKYESMEREKGANHYL